MRSRCTVAGALGVALASTLTVLGPPAAATTNPCGAGYTLRETMPIDQLDKIGKAFGASRSSRSARSRPTVSAPRNARSSA